MSAMFSTPKMPTPPPPVPTAASAVVGQADANQRASMAAAMGRGSTLLTNQQGNMTPTTKQKQLLGQ